MRFHTRLSDTSVILDISALLFPCSPATAGLPFVWALIVVISFGIISVAYSALSWTVFALYPEAVSVEQIHIDRHPRNRNKLTFFSSTAGRKVSVCHP